jgi:hypothetical protein
VVFGAFYGHRKRDHGVDVRSRVGLVDSPATPAMARDRVGGVPRELGIVRERDALLAIAFAWMQPQDRRRSELRFAREATRQLSRGQRRTPPCCQA